VKLKGKCIIRSKVIIRGEYAPIIIGRYVHIGEGCVIRPAVVTVTTNNNDSSPSIATTAASSTNHNNQTISNIIDMPKSIPMTIGSHTNIGKECVIEAAWIGTNVIIGDGCVISKRAIIKDNCKILSNTIIPPGMVIPPFSVVAGCPGRIVGELPESVVVDFVNDSLFYFDQFVFKII